MAEKERADVALVKRGLCESREKAQANIMAGLVYIGQRKVLKASDPVKPEDELILRGKANPFVSRGGLKLEKAIAAFDGTVSGRVCMDIGAAAGGFTDVLLKNGATHVYAIDVGYGQFDWGLRNDSRVTLMERTNARYLTAEQFPLHPTMTVMDVSFISIKLILPVAAQIMGPQGCFYTLVQAISLRWDGTAWAKRVWCATPRPMKRCCWISCALRPPLAGRFISWITRLLQGRRETLNSWPISSRAERIARRSRPRRLPPWWSAPMPH